MCVPLVISSCKQFLEKSVTSWYLQLSRFNQGYTAFTPGCIPPKVKGWRLYGIQPEVNHCTSLIWPGWWIYFLNQINLFCHVQSRVYYVHFQDMPFAHLMHCDVTINALSCFFFNLWLKSGVWKFTPNLLANQILCYKLPVHRK